MFVSLIRATTLHNWRRSSANDLEFSFFSLRHYINTGTVEKLSDGFDIFKVVNCVHRVLSSHEFLSNHHQRLLHLYEYRSHSGSFKSKVRSLLYFGEVSTFFDNSGHLKILSWKFMFVLNLSMTFCCNCVCHRSVFKMSVFWRFKLTTFWTIVIVLLIYMTIPVKWLYTSGFWYWNNGRKKKLFLDVNRIRFS